MLRTTCPNCGTSRDVDTLQFGTRIECQDCGTRFPARAVPGGLSSTTVAVLSVVAAFGLLGIILGGWFAILLFVTALPTRSVVAESSPTPETKPRSHLPESLEDALLRMDTTEHERGHATDYFNRIDPTPEQRQDGRVANRLLRGMKEGDREMQRMCSRGLSKWVTREHVPALLEMLDIAPDCESAICDALQAVPDERVIVPLVERLQKQPTSAVSTVLCKHKEAALPAGRPLLFHPNAKVREKAWFIAVNGGMSRNDTDALIHLGMTRSTAPKEAAEGFQYLASTRPDEDSKVRDEIAAELRERSREVDLSKVAGALPALARWGKDDGEGWFAFLGHDSPLVRDGAVRALRSLGDKIEAKLWLVLRDNSPLTRMAACEVLAEIGTPRSIHPIMLAITRAEMMPASDEQAETLRKGEVALANCVKRRGKGAEFIAIVDQLADDLKGDKLERATAMRELIRETFPRYPSDKLRDVLTAMLDDADPAMRLIAAKGLKGYVLNENVPTVAKGLAKRDPAVRLAILDALALLGDERFIEPAVLPLLKSPDAETRTAVCSILSKTGRFESQQPVQDCLDDAARRMEKEPAFRATHEQAKNALAAIEARIRK